MKALGYILALIGIVIIIFNKAITGLSFLKGIAKIEVYAIVAGIILVIAGLFFLMDSSSVQQAEEVPVYDKSGKKIVGYRRTK